ncbi:hypothetical protein [Armatimonas sp.]|uniref:hypothetical protein n=1 Tax=Armatimonas sp. TaxID=1872638 RepID=UPI003751B888
MKLKLIVLVFALLLSRIASAAVDIWHAVEGTNAPSFRLSIGWGVPGKQTEAEGPNNDDIESVRNCLLDSDGHVIAVLNGLDYFPGQNNGGIKTVWAPNSSVVFLEHQGKWKPNALLLVSASGKQANITATVFADALSFLRRKADPEFSKAEKDTSFIMNRVLLTPGKLTVLLEVGGGKDVDFRDWVELRYSVESSARGIRLTSYEALQG